MAKKEKEVLEIEAEVDTDHAELRVYELGFHIDPDQGEAGAKSVFEGIHAVIEKAGTIVAEGSPQKMQLAYTVSRTEQSVRQDFNASYLGWIAYETDGAGHEAVLAAAKGNRAIFRFLDVRTDKDSAKHAAEMHEIMLKSDVPQVEEEGAADAELDAALKEVGV